MLRARYLVGYGVFLVMLLGCAQTQPSCDVAETINDDKYEKAYLAQYEATKQQHKDSLLAVRWVQPKNKSEACKVYVGINAENDKTMHPDYVLYWDGDCKNGFAYGLGREIEKSPDDGIIEQIGWYENGRAIDYCVLNDLLNGSSDEGECIYENDKASYLTTTWVDEAEGNFEVYMESGVGTTGTIVPIIFSRTYLFHDIGEYWKVYPNFAYAFIDYSKDECDERSNEFYMYDMKTGQKNGYSYISYKSGELVSMEMLNGKFVKEVVLPDAYYHKAKAIIKEIQHHTKLALEAQEKAMALKMKYLKKICNDNVNVDFMNNDEYKAICTRERELGIKVNEKLMQIEAQKKMQREALKTQKNGAGQP